MGWAGTSDGGLWRFESGSDGFTFLLTNLVDVWFDTLQRSDVVKRGEEIGCIADLHEGFDAFCDQIATMLQNTNLKCCSDHVNLLGDTSLGIIRWEFRPRAMPRVFAINVIRGMVFDAIQVAKELKIKVEESKKAISEREFHIRNMEETILACAPRYEPQAFIDAYEESLHPKIIEKAKDSELACWPPLRTLRAEVLPYPYSSVSQNQLNLYGAKSRGDSLISSPSPDSRPLKNEEDGYTYNSSPQSGAGSTGNETGDRSLDKEVLPTKSELIESPKKTHRQALETILRAPKRSKWV